MVVPIAPSMIAMRLSRICSIGCWPDFVMFPLSRQAADLTILLIKIDANWMAGPQLVRLPLSHAESVLIGCYSEPCRIISMLGRLDLHADQDWQSYDCE